MSARPCSRPSGWLTAHAVAAQQLPAKQASRTVRVTGIVRDEMNGIFLPGVPVEVVTGGDVVYTDVDGRFLVQVPRGAHQIRVALEGYEERTISVHLHDLRGSRPQ